MWCVDRYIQISEIGETLHDAEIDLDELERRPSGLVIHGWVEKPTAGRSGARVGRYRFELLLPGAAGADVADPDGIGVVIVGDVRYDPHDAVLEIRSALRGSITVPMRGPDVRIRIDDEPFEVRRWWRWEPTSVE